MIIFFISGIIFIATVAITMAADDSSRKTRELLEEVNKKR